MKKTALLLILLAMTACAELPSMSHDPWSNMGAPSGSNKQPDEIME